jgi:hypothetical protein
MIHLELQPEVEARLAAEAQARGLALDRYVQTLVESCIPVSSSAETPEQAVAEIRKLRKGLSLGGLRVRDLIQEGRKY